MWRRARDLSGLSRRTYAARLGRDESTVRAWEDPSNGTLPTQHFPLIKERCPTVYRAWLCIQLERAGAEDFRPLSERYAEWGRCHGERVACSGGIRLIVEETGPAEVRERFRQRLLAEAMALLALAGGV